MVINISRLGRIDRFWYYDNDRFNKKCALCSIINFGEYVKFDYLPDKPRLFQDAAYILGYYYERQIFKYKQLR